MATKYTFHNLGGRKFSCLDSKDVQGYLEKWGMGGTFKVQTFSFDEEFKPYKAQDLITAALKDATVLGALEMLSSSGTWTNVGIPAEEVVVEPVAATITNMSFFDRLYDEGVVREETDAIRKCFDEFYEDFTISDELRRMLLLEDSDNYYCFSEEERSEFLFRLFRHICLGGPICQYEDNVVPYLDTAKGLYRDFISVKKDGETGQVRVTSHVFKVTAKDSTGAYYPADKDHEQSFSYFVIDPFKRHITVVYNAWAKGIF